MLATGPWINCTAARIPTLGSMDTLLLSFATLFLILKPSCEHPVLISCTHVPYTAAYISRIRRPVLLLASTGKEEYEIADVELQLTR